MLQKCNKYEVSRYLLFLITPSIPRMISRPSAVLMLRRKHIDHAPATEVDPLDIRQVQQRHSLAGSGCAGNQTVAVAE